VPAVEAAALGLVNLVVAAGQVVDALDDLVAALLATPREVATEAKRALLATSSEKELSGKISLSEELAAIVRLAGDDEVNRER
jgi:enoyl-CoA hydratase/carnithine racemase